MRRASRRSIFPRPYIWRLTSLSLVICPSVWPLDQGRTMAARTAVWSFAMPLANDATRLVRARAIQESEVGGGSLAHHGLEERNSSRASTKRGSPLSMAAIVTVSAFESAFLPHRRALLLGRVQSRLRHGPPRPRLGPLPPDRPPHARLRRRPGRQIFRDLVDMPADVAVTPAEVEGALPSPRPSSYRAPIRAHRQTRRSPVVARPIPAPRR